MFFKRNRRAAIPANRVVVVGMSDIHSGHDLGLLRPGTVLYEVDAEGNESPTIPELTPIQEWLWATFEQNVAQVEEIAAGSPIIVLHGGDATHGEKHPARLVSNRQSDQIAIATFALARWFELDNLAAFRLVQGTGAHNMGYGSSELVIRDQLRALFPGVDVKFSRHYLLVFGGVPFDIAHHGPGTGIREWTKGNVARLYCESIMQGELERRKDPPRVVFRGHVHDIVWKTARKLVYPHVYQAEMVVCPSFCGMNDFAAQITRSKGNLVIGMFVFVIENGRLVDVIPLWDEKDIRTKEELF